MSRGGPDTGWSKLFIVLCVLAAVGLAGYAVSYLVAVPEVGSGGFVPASLGDRDGTPSTFATVLAGFAPLYAFAFLPVAVMVTASRYQVAPSAGVYPGRLEPVPADVLLRLI